MSSGGTRYTAPAGSGSGSGASGQKNCNSRDMNSEKPNQKLREAAEPLCEIIQVIPVQIIFVIIFCRQDGGVIFTT
jgi:hypothetical protein